MWKRWKRSSSGAPGSKKDVLGRSGRRDQPGSSSAWCYGVYIPLRCVLLRVTIAIFVMAAAGGDAVVKVKGVAIQPKPDGPADAKKRRCGEHRKCPVATLESETGVLVAALVCMSSGGDDQSQERRQSCALGANHMPRCLKARQPLGSAREVVRSTIGVSVVSRETCYIDIYWPYDLDLRLREVCAAESEHKSPHCAVGDGD
jgi:hypothetical protein